MSVCDPANPCEKCSPGSYAARVAAEKPYTPTPVLSKKKRKELERMIEELEDIKREARKLTRSGHPGVRAEALRHLENARQDLVWLRSELRA